MDPGLISVDPSGLVLEQSPPAYRNPADIYLGRRSFGSREAAREALDRIAALLTEGRGTAHSLAWHLLRAPHTAAVRAALAEQYPTTVANKMLAALRGVLKECWKLGLTSAADYRAHARPTVEPDRSASGRAPSRSQLVSVLSEEGPPAPPHNEAVRALLHGNGLKDMSVDTERDTPDPQAGASSRKTVVTERLHVRKVTAREAVVHALWEADACLRQWAFCACLTMLRQALDLWSAEYRDRHGMTFRRAAGEQDTLYWRLTKIASENTACRGAIQAIIRELADSRDSDAHDVCVCLVGHPMSYDSQTAAQLRASYKHLHEQVVALIAATTPDLPL